MKLSGDGTRFLSTISFNFLTFSFPDLAKDILDSSGRIGWI